MASAGTWLEIESGLRILRMPETATAATHLIDPFGARGFSAGSRAKAGLGDGSVRPVHPRNQLVETEFLNCP
jgi:hypothetical protein